MVVKPHDFISKGRGYADPAVICRGPEYLRILYGPEYLLPKNLELLCSRDLGANRAFASREFAIGIASKSLNGREFHASAHGTTRRPGTVVKPHDIISKARRGYAPPR